MWSSRTKTIMAFKFVCLVILLGLCAFGQAGKVKGKQEINIRPRGHFFTGLLKCSFLTASSEVSRSFFIKQIWSIFNIVLIVDREDILVCKDL